jgi:hypothetical protein
VWRPGDQLRLEDFTEVQGFFGGRPNLAGKIAGLIEQMNGAIQTLPT